jgi:hypothetical protein
MSLPLVDNAGRVYAIDGGGMPSMAFNFASESLVDVIGGQTITFTRASSGTRFNSAGTLVTETTNVARFDYNPSTLAALGLLMEEARTNSVRNNTMVGVVPGTPGTDPTNWFASTSLTGITKQIVGSSTESGISYTDYKISGTPSGAGIYLLAFESNTGIAATVGQVWTETAFLKLVAGTTSGVTDISLRIDERTAVAYLSTQAGPATNPTAASLASQRKAFTFTMAQATAANVLPYVAFNLTGAAIDITLRIGMPQVELGAFATSVLATTTVAATRAVDTALMTGTNFSSWYNQTEGTFVIKRMPVSRAFIGVVAEFARTGVSDGTQFNFMTWRYVTDPTAPTQDLIVVVNPTVWVDSNSYAVTDNVSSTVAFGYKLNDIGISVNGEVAEVDTACEVPPVTQLIVMGNTLTGVAERAAWISSIAYYNTRRSNTDLVVLSRAGSEAVFNGGLRYDNDGHLVIDSVGAIANYVQGGLPVTAAGALATEDNGAPVFFIAGIPISATGRVCAVPAVVPTVFFAFSNAFSTAFDTEAAPP